MTKWSGLKASKERRIEGETVQQKEFDSFVAYQNAKGWMTKSLFKAEMKRFSEHLARVDRGSKHLIIVDNFSGHSVDLESLGIKNIQLAYFKAGTTGRFQPCDLLYFAGLKQRYRRFLREFRQKEQVSSPGLELAVKTVSNLANSMSAGLVRLCWKKMGLRRFQNLEVILLFLIYIESVLLRLTMFPMNQIYSKGMKLKELRKNLVF